MFSSLLARSALGVVATGGVMGGAYLAKPYLFPKKTSIEDKLKKDKWEILKFKGHDKEWKEIYGKYKDKELSDPSRFNQEISKGEEESTGLPKLKKSCEMALTEDFRELLYGTVTKWCVVPISAADRLVTLGEGYKKINVEETNTSDDSDTWTSREATFKGDLNSNNSYLGVTLPSTQNTSAENIKLLKAGCKKHMEKKNYEDDFKGSMEKSKKWCSK